MRVNQVLLEHRPQTLKNLISEEGVLLRMNRSIQVEGVFGVLKEDYGFRRFLTRGKKNIETYNIAVVDTIFNPRKLSKQDIQNLRYLPFTDNKVEFILEAAHVNAGNVKVPVVECRAPYKMYLDTVEYRQNIINLIDDRVNNFNAYAGLKFGSMEGSNNEAGNWE